jgi:hypothetical protein
MKLHLKPGSCHLCLMVLLFVVHVGAWSLETINVFGDAGAATCLSLLPTKARGQLHAAQTSSPARSKLINYLH